MMGGKCRRWHHGRCCRGDWIRSRLALLPLALPLNAFVPLAEVPRSFAPAHAHTQHIFTHLWFSEWAGNLRWSSGHISLARHWPVRAVHRASTDVPHLNTHTRLA